jgi:hypothetical protein
VATRPRPARLRARPSSDRGFSIDIGLGQRGVLHADEMERGGGAGQGGKPSCAITEGREGPSMALGKKYRGKGVVIARRRKRKKGWMTGEKKEETEREG